MKSQLVTVVTIVTLLSVLTAAQPFFIAAPSAPWSVRYGMYQASIDGLIVMGGGVFTSGSGVTTRYNDVWTSADGGLTWAQATNQAQWGVRGNGASAVFVLPGTTRPVLLLLGSGASTDVWANTDNTFATWNQVTSSSCKNIVYAFTAAVVALNTGAVSSIYLLGGFNGGGTYRPAICASTDAVNWVQYGSSPAWGNRYNVAAAAVDAGTRLIVIGGYSGSLSGPLNDVWTSDLGGFNWIPLSAVWPQGRQSANLVNIDEYLYLLGGTDFSGSLESRFDVLQFEAPKQSAVAFNDVWLSSDAGNTFVQISAADTFNATWRSSVVTVGRRIVRFGGQLSPNTGSYINNVFFGYIPLTA